MGEGHPKAEIKRVYDSYAIGSYEGFVLWVVDGHTPVDELEALRQTVARWREDAPPKKTVALTVIHDRRTTMNNAERQTVRRMIEDTKHDRSASATVILASGMIGALHRSILTGFTLLVPPPHPAKIFGTVEEAVDFLHPYIDEVCTDLRRHDVLAMVDQLHAEVLKRAPPGTDPPLTPG